jgi:hypothetical protein
LDPALPELKSLATSRWFPNFTGVDSSVADLEFCGVGFESLRDSARREAVRLAADYTSGYLGTAGTHGIPASSVFDEGTAILLSGHQPELFHSGVWFKNFLLSHLATQSGAVAINFLVDNDLCRQTAISVPGLEANGSVKSRKVEFDRQRAAIPWELRTLESQSYWESFSDRVCQRLESLVRHEPLIQQLWPLACESLERNGNLGQALAEGRHRLEVAQGLRTLEIPLSLLTQTESFARFSLQLISELPRFQEIYNSQREAYRRAHKIRNEAHPVPPLEQEHGWIEGPWWIYRVCSPQRRRLWMRLVDDQLILSDRAGWQEVIEGGLDCDAAPQQWLDLQLEHVYIRPRALLTTMYTRLMIGDLFLHGIGGGKYDQLTDGIIRDFFGIEPPRCAIASATLHLPNACGQALNADEVESEIQSVKDRIWRCQHHPEEFEDELGEQGRKVLAEKAALLEDIPPRGQKWEWHQKMRRVSEQLKELTQHVVNSGESELVRLQSELRQAELLESREFSFCLFPLESTSAALKQLSNGSASEDQS